MSHHKQLLSPCLWTRDLIYHFISISTQIPSYLFDSNLVVNEWMYSCSCELLAVNFIHYKKQAQKKDEKWKDKRLKKKRWEMKTMTSNLLGEKKSERW